MLSLDKGEYSLIDSFWRLYAGGGGGREKVIHLNEIESQGFVPRMCRAHFNFLKIFWGGGVHAQV